MELFAADRMEANEYAEYDGGPKTESRMSPELLAGAAAYEADKAYAAHVESAGRPDGLPQAQALFDAMAGAFVDREIQAHDFDFLDKAKVKELAGERGAAALSSHF
ncbi:DUF3759 domain-containing protein [Streptomyces griseus]